MKKLMLVLIGLSMFAVSAFAITGDAINNDYETAERYEQEKTKTETIIPKDQHIEDKYASVKLEYNPMYDEVRIYYTTSSASFDRGQAMNTVLQCLNDFRKEHKYIDYRYLQEPKEKSFIDKESKPKKKYTQYFCYVQMRGKSNIGEIAGSSSDSSSSDAE